MNLAVMQPYLFPYLGYFQLIYASDLFIVYDDVSYIKQGYINRNSILMDGAAQRFTLPVPGASSNKIICQLKFSEDVRKVIKTISQAYSRSPYYPVVFPMLREILESERRTVSDVCLNSFESIFSYLDVDRKFIKSSEIEYDRSLSAQDRLIHLCKMHDANGYINTIGGLDLYSKARFSEHRINLMFLKAKLNKYRQNATKFIPGLSIIDVLMNCSPDEIRSLLLDYDLV